MKRLFYIAGTFFWMNTMLLANQVPDSSAASAPLKEPAESINMGWLFFKTMGILALIIALILVAVYVLKKYVLGSSAIGGQSSWLRILGQAQLQPKKYVSLVKVMDKVLLIGHTDSSMQTLTEFNDLNQIKPFLDELQNRPGSITGQRFLGMMKKNLES